MKAFIRRILFLIAVFILVLCLLACDGATPLTQMSDEREQTESLSSSDDV